MGANCWLLRLKYFNSRPDVKQRRKFCDAFLLLLRLTQFGRSGVNVQTRKLCCFIALR